MGPGNVTRILAVCAVLEVSLAACQLDSAPLQAKLRLADAGAKSASQNGAAAWAAAAFGVGVLPGRDDDDAGAGLISALPNGEACTQDAECASQHCNSGLCCGGGECCKSAADCGPADAVIILCDDPRQCQGTRGRSACSDFHCDRVAVEEDDSACTDEVKVDSCGDYRSVYCDGRPKQERPPCPTSCADDSACDPGVTCQSGVCGGKPAPTEPTTTPPPAPPAAMPCASDKDCGDGRCRDGQCCDAKDKDCVASAPVDTALRGRCMRAVAPDIMPGACKACACEHCGQEVVDCNDSPDPSRTNRCRTFSTCGYYAGCSDSCTAGKEDACLVKKCFCGQGNTACTTPYGPCSEALSSAGESSDFAQLVARTTDPAYPLYYARAVAECVSTHCENECSR